MRTLRPADLAREHGLSTQAVRNYEQDGFLPPAERTPTGYRIYTEVHAAALRAFLALVPAYGHAAAGRIMNALHDNDLDKLLLIVDRGHIQLLHDRETLDAVRKTVGHLTSTESAVTPEPAADENPLTIGELARRLRLTAATLRAWEDASILRPSRDRATGYRRYRASDIRDAELAHLLRRGGYPLAHIETVVNQIRTAGGTAALAAALADWHHKLTTQGLAMLDAAAELSRYRSIRGDRPPDR
ncbi:MerR family transcriptional regulator [Nocardia crassostreae]|uniref:MerR family transcriptional regulator n=1 Tax=Nocardia crassostreae TaxID=53428 RepID=UPI00083492DE|nr:MerR family transcriptional regulator [Nocardia crassostreae]